jgi:hypothetical protein
VPIWFSFYYCLSLQILMPFRYLGMNFHQCFNIFSYNIFSYYNDFDWKAALFVHHSSMSFLSRNLHWPNYSNAFYLFFMVSILVLSNPSIWTFLYYTMIYFSPVVISMWNITIGLFSVIHYAWITMLVFYKQHIQFFHQNPEQS